MKAKDIMTTSVVTVDPNDDVALVARRLLDRRISAAPVIDKDARLCGIVSEGDLMRRAERGCSRSWWLELLADKTIDFTRSLGTRIRDVMTRDVVSIKEETPISEVARILEEKRIKRVPVLRDGRLVGIVSRADVLRGLASVGSRSVTSSSADDRQIRATILEMLDRQTWASLEAVSVIVINGVVYLWGIAQSEADKDAIRIAAENVVGVSKVHNFLSTLHGVLSGVWQGPQRVRTEDAHD